MQVDEQANEKQCEASDICVSLVEVWKAFLWTQLRGLYAREKRLVYTCLLVHVSLCT